MWSRAARLLAAIAAWAALTATTGRVLAAAPAENKFHLKPGAAGTTCVGCHADFADTLKLPFVHAPVKNGDCVDCHSPHASTHEKMLAAETSKICFTCHDGIVPKDAKSSHAPAREGTCVKCHDPHASKNKDHLVTGGNDLCLGCHKDIASAIKEAQFKHNPVEKGCVTCHDPHASTKSEFLLSKDVTSLCTSCHKADQPAFSKAHLGYPVSKGRCTSCHDPHGSNNRGILWATVHPPVASRLCAQCHNEASSPAALQTKKEGIDVCRSCHGNLINEASAAKRVHWPVFDKIACLNCHGPHATKQAKLLKQPTLQLCGTCHADTIEREAKSLTKHAPVAAGDCATCHAPHASDNPLLLVKANVIELCGSCHDYGQHSSHPLGDKAVDPRNANLRVTCSSCHRNHGSTFKAFTPYDPKVELCVQCHQGHKR